MPLPPPVDSPPRKARRTATPDQTISTTPNGQAPDQKPYALDSRHPTPNKATKLRPRGSSAYIAIMKVTAQIP